MTFPLSGVIGIVATQRDEIDLAVECKLQCIELRSDLLLDRGHSLQEVMAMVRQASEKGLACLFTLRRHDHGGKFSGTDQEQIRLCLDAAKAGANIVDVEWDSSCAADMVNSGVPTILSYHNFDGMPSETDLDAITDRITEIGPAAIKVVPTGKGFDDAIRMLRWVSWSTDSLRRIGFTMGRAGEFSRILTLAFGGPITYATFDAPIVPGQIPINLLLNRYHAQAINQGTRVTGVIGNHDATVATLEEINLQAGPEGRMVAVPLPDESIEHIQQSATFLRMDRLVGK